MYDRTVYSFVIVINCCRVYHVKINEQTVCTPTVVKQ